MAILCIHYTPSGLTVSSPLPARQSGNARRKRHWPEPAQSSPTTVLPSAGAKWKVGWDKTSSRARNPRRRVVRSKYVCSSQLGSVVHEQVISPRHIPPFSETCLACFTCLSPSFSLARGTCVTASDVPVFVYKSSPGLLRAVWHLHCPCGAGPAQTPGVYEAREQ